MDCHQDGAINFFKDSKAISKLGVWVAFEQRAPPAHQNNDGIDAGGAARVNVRRVASGPDFVPPLYNVSTEGSCFESVVLLIVVSILEKCTHHLWPFIAWKSFWSL